MKSLANEKNALCEENTIDLRKKKQIIKTKEQKKGKDKNRKGIDPRAFYVKQLFF